MNIHQSLGGLAVACLLAVAGCSSNMDGSTARSYDGGGNSGASSTPSSGMGSSSGTSSSSGSSGGTAAATTGGYGLGAPGTAQAQYSYGTVQSIDPVARTDAGVGASGAVGAAAAGGTSAPMPTGTSYRVMVKMDDGNSQMVMVDNPPVYKIGDRVRYSNGMLERY